MEQRHNIIGSLFYKLWARDGGNLTLTSIKELGINKEVYPNDIVNDCLIVWGILWQKSGFMN